MKKPHYVLTAAGPVLKTPLTHVEARDLMLHQGITLAQWARDHKFSEPLVREVMSGRKKFLRGQSHNIAVALGMKHGTPTTRPARVSPAQLQAGVAA